ncbi:3-hydroxyacyl-[acyl-carrier-protein] dehydratase [Paenibacillus cellulosilyticus]|uniref:3-hydroxyacyl-[acyl-carrier-protein] dehydratase FabZ n=1 Tax=Paenibacillus cellulosilyticus TaxID=375489 RepID=A0A2V2YPX7_9BACL|nr:3-hydroxyacyl-ACP dehydratase FabZ [Paenibacillus cellulosilyticus]PWV98570.1 3-hydroxyacyl-[acyl-carrier-protein] dehydratase [Paenibacillus cellulosilyticus]QKS44174.1 3-hydroxyacyl-ACP dehydratase FabZ [Paenibacillus cellulosilyticus]
MLDIVEIKRMIPHRYPFLLVDRVVTLEPGAKAVGIKNVTINEPYFEGHFPEYPVMPGVLIVEALAQVGGIATFHADSSIPMIGLLAGIDNCRFKRQVKPGDQLTLTFEVTRMKGQIIKGKGTATVDGELACEAEIMFALQAI